MSDLPAEISPAASAVLASIDNAPLAESTKDQYRRAVLAYLETGEKLTDAAALAAYARTASKSRRAFLKAAVARWSEYMIDQAKAGATPSNIDLVQATIYRFESLQNAVTAPRSVGMKPHTWLSPAEVKRLMSLPGPDIYGRRDRAALGLLVGAGLRRSEAVALRFDDIIEQPVYGRVRWVLSVRGKGEKDRAVSISDRLKQLVDIWGEEVGHRGRVIRSLGRAARPGRSLSDVGLFNIVRKYGEKMGKPKLAPHDLRRTFAQIGYENDVPLLQLSELLGHDSMETTRRYLAIEVDLTMTVSDFVPL